MTLKTSYFNKGIYKSTLKRYMWGSVLYFLILFVSTGLSVLLNTEATFSYMPYDYFYDYPVILHGSYITIPILLAIVVPSVVALLVFRFIHSKKQTVFIHSLPVSRKANYISTIAAAFTLMFVPVIANGLTLALISLCGYARYFTVADCFAWTGFNLAGIFLMFSCAVFASNLTGNSFAAAAINIFIHVFLFVIVSAFGIMASTFLYGYTGSNQIYEAVVNNNFAVVVFGFTDKYFRTGITPLEYGIYFVAAIILYGASYFLYKKRKLETTGDVAAFKCLGGIFKYLVTFTATMFGFAAFSSYTGENAAVFGIIMIIISIVAYAVSEMLLKKTLNVLYSWKGYAIYALGFVAVILLFSQTSFFGFETRIPQKEDIKAVAVYNYYHVDDEPFTDDGKIIDEALKIHSSFAGKKPIPVINDNPNYYTTENQTRIHIKYKLKNGKSVNRVYPISVKEFEKIMDKLYEDDAFKQKCEPIFVDESRIINVHVEGEYLLKDCTELIHAIRQDVMNLSYRDLHPGLFGYSEDIRYIGIEYRAEKANEKDRAYSSGTRYMHVEITDKFENTIKWLEENKVTTTAESELVD